MSRGMKRTAWVAAATLMMVAFAWTVFSDRAADAQSGSRYGSGRSFRGSTSGRQSLSAAQSAAQPRTFEQRFWAYLEDAQYKNWAPLPGHSGDFYPGNSPHGKFVKLYMNRIAAGNPKNPPHGSILVKENYGPKKQKLMAVTVMYRVKDYDPKNGDWYWAKYEADGRISKMKSMPIAGKVMMCTKCHAGADGKDYVFAND